MQAETNTATDAVTNAAEAVADKAKSATEAVTTVASDAVQFSADSANKAGEAVKAAAEKTGEAVSSAADKATEAAKAATEKTGEAVTAAADKATETAKAATEKTGEAVEAAAEKTGEAVSAAAEKATDTAKAATEKTGEAVSAVADKAADTAKAATEKTTEAVEAAAEKTGEAVEAVADKAGEATKAVAEKTGEVAEKTGEAVEAAAEKTGEAVEAVADKAGETVEAATEAVDGAVGSIAEKLTDAGDAAGGATSVDPNMIFVLGIFLLALFIWYFVSEQANRRRLVGSILALVVAGLSAFFFNEYGIEKGIELEGGVSMEIKIKPVQGREITPETQQQVIKVLNKRINSLGTGDVILAPSGKDGVFLQVPGVGPEALKQMEEDIQKVAKLEFSVVHEGSMYLAQMVANDAHVEPGYEALPYAQTDEEKAEGAPIRYELVKIVKDMSGKEVSKAAYRFGQDGHSIVVDFTTKGSGIMGPLTLENQGRQLAIIMDNEVISAPRINEPFSMGCSITGDFTQEEAKALVAALNNPLENPIEIAHSNYISPSMGAVTVKQGVMAGIAGLAVTLVFILIYYNVAGAIALIGLILNIVIIFGALALFRFTLTLPGIAGIILTIGVAIDANVLIYERLREELKAGKSLKAAIDTAYEKAFSAIMDANITTLITALILYFLATGTVKGFAITLIIGIVASLFSALIVTRACFGWATASFLKKLGFLNIIPEKAIDFLGKRKKAAFISIVLVIASLIAVPFKDPRGVELKGGDSVTIQASSDLTSAKIEEALKGADLTALPIVQKQTPVGGEGSFFLVRVPDNEAGVVQEQLSEKLGIAMESTTVNSVGSQIGKSMLISSGIALLVGLVAILFYVTIRFEFAFALGAIAALFHDLIITAGILTLLGQEFSLITVGALLTIAGYSINDTIVVFDRVREGLATKRGNVKDIMNYCLNATLARTILTSATTLIIVVVLFLFGGPGMRNFALALIIGVMIGTYSSIFVASPIVLWWARRSGTNLRRAVLDTEQAKVDPLASA